MRKKLLSLLLICSISLTFTFNSYANYGRHEYFELESKYNTYFFMFYGSSLDASDEDFCVSIICDQPNVTYSLRLKNNTTGQVVAKLLLFHENSGSNTDDNSKVKTCFKCNNDDIYDGYYCIICQSYIVNRCTNHRYEGYE